MKPLSSGERRALREWDPSEELYAWADEVQSVEACRNWNTGHLWNTDRRTGFMHASTFNKGCDMMLLLERMGADGIPKMRGKTRRILDLGTAAHDMMDFYQGTRAFVNSYKYENNVPVFIDGLYIGGAADGLTLGWPIDRPILWEYKTINKKGVANLRKPNKDYRVQTNVYMKALGIPVVVFVYISKDDSMFYHFIIDFDEGLWNMIERKAQQINVLADALTEDAPRRVSDSCFYCPYFEECEPPIKKRRFVTAPVL
jgi:hypothetical protein